MNKNRRFAQLTAAIVGLRGEVPKPLILALKKKCLGLRLALNQSFPWVECARSANQITTPRLPNLRYQTSKVDSPPLKGLAGAAFGTTSTSRSLRSSPIQLQPFPPIPPNPRPTFNLSLSSLLFTSAHPSSRQATLTAPIARDKVGHATDHQQSTRRRALGTRAQLGFCRARWEEKTVIEVVFPKLLLILQTNPPTPRLSIHSLNSFTSRRE